MVTSVRGTWKRHHGLKKKSVKDRKEKKVHYIKKPRQKGFGVPAVRLSVAKK